MFRSILFFSSLTLFFVGVFFVPSAASAATYDIKNQYCGVYIDFKFCKCAFHDQYCGSIGMDQDSANAHVYNKFNAWVAEQEAKKRAACENNGGRYVNGACTYEEEESSDDESSDDKKEDAEGEDEVDEEEGEDEDGEEEGDSDENEAVQLKECAAPAEKLDVKKNECICSQLYTKGKDGECFFKGHDGISLDVETSIEVQETIEGMELGSGAVIEVADANGKPIKIGVIRKPNGDYVFTSDGQHFYDDMKSAGQPGVWTRIKEGWGDFWNGFAGLFGVGTYVGRDTAGDPAAQQAGQDRYDAGKDAFRDLREAANDPEQQLADATALQGLWQGRGTQLFGEQYEDFVLSEIKNATGYDAKQIKQVIEGDFSGLGMDQVNAIKDALYAAPAQAVVTLATELRDNDFANAAALYMREREAGKTPVQIMQQLESGELPELEYASTKGTGAEFADVMLMMGYEDAYQRYQLQQQLR